MRCCCAGRRRKVYAVEHEAEARVHAVMAARREAKQRDERTAAGTDVGVVGRRASVGADTRRLSGSSSFSGRRGSLSSRRDSSSITGRRGSLSSRRASNSFSERRGSLSNTRGSLSADGAVLTTQGFGAAAARRRSGNDEQRGGTAGNRQARRRRWSVESRSPLSPVTESPHTAGRSLAGPEEDDEELPLIARAALNRKSVTNRKSVSNGLVRTRSGSQPHALSPTMRGTPAKGGRTKKSTMEMLLLMDNVNITDLHKAGTTLDELLLMGFGPKVLAAVRTQKSSGLIVPIFPLRDIKQNYKIDRRWLSDKVGMDANLFSRTVR